MPVVKKHNFNFVKWAVILIIVGIFIYFTSKVNFTHFNDILKKGPLYILAYGLSWVLFVGLVFFINKYWI